MQNLVYRLVATFFVILSPNFLWAQYSSIDPFFNNPVSASIVSNGVAWKDKSTSLLNNPSLLLNEGRHFLMGGIHSTYGLEATSPVLPTAAGFFVAYEKSIGWGMSLKKTFGRSFPDSDRMDSYMLSLFFSYKLMPNLFVSAGVGPSMAFRRKASSNNSLSAYSGISYILDSWIFAIQGEYYGKLKYQNYRGGDKLVEVFPPKITAGVYKSISLEHSVYLEVNKLFWEKTTFGMNGLEERAKWDRGIGAEAKLSLGYQYYHTTGIYPMQFRGGLEFGGSYSNTGKNRRTTGIGIGMTILIIESNYTKDTLGIDFAITDYSWGKSKEKPAETIFQFALKYEFGEAP